MSRSGQKMTGRMVRAGHGIGAGSIRKNGYRTAAAAMMIAALSLAASTCSLSNHEGPSVTCEDLQCGRVNACQDGIVASCADGKTVKYHVCLKNADDICDEDWQIAGQYRCDEFIADCEGCWSDREGCPTNGGAAGGGP